MATLSEKLKKISPQRWALSILIVIGLVGLIMMTFKTNPKIVKAVNRCRNWLPLFVKSFRFGAIIAD